MSFATYLLASGPQGTLYCGSTDELTRRVSQHRLNLRPGFTARHGVHRLVWFEWHDTREGAFRRERRIKEWRRAWKIRLIEEQNPRWLDLYDALVNAIEDGVAPFPLPLIPAKAGTQATVVFDPPGALQRHPSLGPGLRRDEREKGG